MCRKLLALALVLLLLLALTAFRVGDPPPPRVEPRAVQARPIPHDAPARAASGAGEDYFAPVPWQGSVERLPRATATEWPYPVFTEVYP